MLVRINSRRLLHSPDKINFQIYACTMRHYPLHTNPIKFIQ